jgi:hypothetical protein
VVKRDRRLRLTTSLPSESGLSRKCESLDVLQPYRSLWTVTVLLIFFSIHMKVSIAITSKDHSMKVYRTHRVQLQLVLETGSIRVVSLTNRPTTLAICLHSTCRRPYSGNNAESMTKTNSLHQARIEHSQNGLTANEDGKKMTFSSCEINFTSSCKRFNLNSCTITNHDRVVGWQHCTELATCH